jgi:hypothetical protein
VNETAVDTKDVFLAHNLGAQKKKHFKLKSLHLTKNTSIAPANDEHSTWARM